MFSDNLDLFAKRLGWWYLGGIYYDVQKAKLETEFGLDKQCLTVQKLDSLNYDFNS